MSEPSVSDRRTLLTGWGRTAPTSARLLEPTAAGELKALLRAAAPAGSRGVIARGLGRSYGDAAQNAGGSVVSALGLDRILAFDRVSGRLTAEAGMSLDALIRHALPGGWFVPVTPGTRFVTLGGALAADVHGKNHHGAGSFARHVDAFDLLLPSGEVRSLTAETEPDLFWATAGGMGLTGIVLRLTVRLRRVETGQMLVDTTRAPDLDSVMAALEAADAKQPYTVAWIDGTATGARLGRGVVTAGDHAPADALPHAPASPTFDPPSTLAAPGWVPPRLLNRISVRAFNEFWYRKAPRRRTGELQPLTTFFHPLDRVDGWNRAYGSRGFVQHQFVVPESSADVVRRVLERLTAAGAPSFLGVIKKFGPGNPGLLSFPRPGWTLALDIPADVDGLAELLDRFDRLVADVGGTVYLAKDGRMDPDLVDTFYPRADDFRALRARIDPSGTFVSDLSRRLSL